MVSMMTYRYIQCMHQKLYHLTSGEYEDFVNVVCAARAAFHITPEGHVQFKERLQSIKRYCLLKNNSSNLLVIFFFLKTKKRVNTHSFSSICKKLYNNSDMYDISYVK